MEDPLKAYNDVLKITGGENIDREIYELLEYTKEEGGFTPSLYNKSYPVDSDRLRAIKDAELLGLVVVYNDVVSITPEGLATLDRYTRGNTFIDRYDIMGTPVYGEAVANEMPFVNYPLQGGKWVCPDCAKDIPIINSIDDPETFIPIKDHMKYEHNYTDNQVENVLGIDYHSQQAHKNNLYRDGILGKSYFGGKWYDNTVESKSSEADNYPQKQQMSQADWNDDLDDMRKTFGGANDEIEEEDGLDEDRVEIDISGDDVEIEDFDDEEESEEFADQGGDDEPEMEAEWKEIEDITEESYASEGMVYKNDVLDEIKLKPNSDLSYLEQMLSNFDDGDMTVSQAIQELQEEGKIEWTGRGYSVASNESYAGEYTLEELNNAGMEWDNSSIQQRKKIIINTHNGYTSGHDNNIVKSWNELDDHTKSIITDNWSHAFKPFDEDRKAFHGLTESYASEEDGTDFDNDGDIDSKDYLEAKDRAIKKSIDEESYSEEGLYEDYIEMFPEDKWRTGGGFGQALKDNDLATAYQRADLGNRDRLEKITGKSRDELERIAYGDESYASEYEDPIYEFNCSICGFNGIEENNNDLLENHYRDTHNITWDNNPQQMSNAMRYELERMNPDDTEEQMIQDWDNPTW